MMTNSDIKAVLVDSSVKAIVLFKRQSTLSEVKGILKFALDSTYDPDTFQHRLHFYATQKSNIFWCCVNTKELIIEGDLVTAFGFIKEYFSNVYYDDIVSRINEMKVEEAKINHEI